MYDCYPATCQQQALRKQAYSNILIILQPEKENFQIKTFDIFLISVQNIVCGCSLEPPLRGGSNEYPQSMFFSRNRKNNVYPCKPQFYYIKVRFKGVKVIKVCFRHVRLGTVRKSPERGPKIFSFNS